MNPIIPHRPKMGSPPPVRVGVVFAVLILTAAIFTMTGARSWADSPPAKTTEVFKDCADCPEMLTIQPGAYVMGSTQEERTRLGVPPLFDKMESPRHPVAIAHPFALGRFAVTFDQWDACVAEGGCGGYRPDDNGWGRGRRPVINVNWADAEAYVTWLSRKTSQPYRLPSEAEWEYAARGGTTTAYYFGPTITDADANFGSHRGKTLEVGSLPPNPFGLYDMTGNTAEWLQDCHHESYEGAPADGSAWMTGPCLRRNVRGGGWSLEGWSVRSAQRIGDQPAARNNHLGFRVARTLAP